MLYLFSCPCFCPVLLGVTLPSFSCLCCLLSAELRCVTALAEPPARAVHTKSLSFFLGSHLCAFPVCVCVCYNDVVTREREPQREEDMDDSGNHTTGEESPKFRDGRIAQLRYPRFSSSH